MRALSFVFALSLLFGMCLVIPVQGCSGKSSSRPDGASGTGGASGSGDANGTDAIPSPCIPACTSAATCCDGTVESCDGTRLPSGDGTNAGQFVVSADALTVADTITGLVWQRDGSGTRAGCTECSGTGNVTCEWAEATAYCAALTLGGLSGWRLPAVSELRTIVDLTRASPAIDAEAFPSTTADRFWTSSPFAAAPSNAWYVDFDTGGYSNYYPKDGCFWVRCVR